jgi:ABC-type molybdate transport system substrate-binding protein
MLICINALIVIRQSFVMILRHTKHLLAAAILLSGLGAQAAVPQIPESETLLSLVLMADREQAIPLSNDASEYSRQQHVSVATAFNPPEYVLASIAEGEQCDLYLTSYPGMTEVLRTRGLIDVYATTPLRKEQLVLAAARGWWKEAKPARWRSSIGPKSNLPAQLKPLGEIQLLVGEPNHVASGRYGSDVLQKQRWYVPLTSRINYTPSTAATLQRLLHPGMVGIVYRSDLATQPELEEIAVFTDALVPEIWLYGNVVAGERMTEARNFLRYLQARMEQNNMPAAVKPR